MIEIESLGKSFGRNVGVDGLDLTIPRGSVFGFIGRNGAGKTTTIRLMMGLLVPDQGRIRLGGYDIARQREQALAITGYLPDQPYLYDKLTPDELLAFVAGLHGLRRRHAVQRAAVLLTEMALAAQRGDLIETFSHGMKQRLALACALVHEPSILVLDEPMVGLDPQGARDLRTLLRRLAAGGSTIFLSTHSLAVAEEICDRFGILDQGRLIAEGDLDSLRARVAGRGAGASLETAFLEIVAAREGEW